MADSCVRVLVEPLDADPQEAVAHAAATEEVLIGAGISLEQVHHGDELASWARYSLGGAGGSSPKSRDYGHSP